MTPETDQICSICRR